MQKNIRIKPANRQEEQASIDIILQGVKDNIKSKRQLFLLQRKFCEKYKINFVSNPVLLNTYRILLKEKKITENKDLFELLRKRRIRTSSGIASVAVLTKPYECPGKCIFCPTQEDIPKSYIDNEPAVMRAVLAKFDPISQMQIRLRGFKLAGNPADKIELIVMGGTFSYLPKNYQLKFIVSCFAACNRFDNKLQMSKFKRQIKPKMSNNQLLQLLKKEQKRNETAKYRIIGLTLETRPDYIDEREVFWFRELGCTRVELGVQSIDDEILSLNNRGHGCRETARATQLLKNAGFKICYHMMPNLYGSDIDKDLAMFKQLFADERFQPDMIKIYPCVVTKYAKLQEIYEKGKYIPYTDEQLIELLIKIKEIIPPYVRIQRLIRDIPADNIIAGSKVSNLRQILQLKHAKCQCIRCREIRELAKKNIRLDRIDYDASGGKEIFLQYIDEDNRLYGLLRLRINKIDIMSSSKHKFKIYSAIIREVHTYGPLLEVGARSKKDPQHSGIGMRLIAEAQRIAKEEYKCTKIAVISGVGVRDYYRKSGYKLKNTYMEKNINN